MEADKSQKELMSQNNMFHGQDKETIMEHLRQSIIGDFSLFHTPFGIKPLVYADYVASARGLDFIEKYLVECVLPFYANTHTFTSYVGAQTGTLREEARHIIKDALHGTVEDVVLFVGSGSTAAINKMVALLKQSNWGTIQGFYGQGENGKFPCLACGEKFESDGPFKKHVSEKHQQKSMSPSSERPVVFVTVYEHHSNLLPWRENGCDVVVINDDENNMLDLDHLRRELDNYSDRKHIIGSFSACSNVTGIVTDVVAITDLMKERGALVFFDYAGGGPYLTMNMNPKGHHSVDGMFISGHKFLGGPGTPGILCVKRRLLGNSSPITTGGGTVFLVSKERHLYMENPEEKEEGGTPDIMGAIRLGLVFHLKSSIGDKFIMETEFRHFKNVVKKLEEIPNFVLLGSKKAKRIPIISFMVKHEDKFFHFGYISALLNDLFGIETRGGCACAAPYAHHLMNFPNDVVEKYNDYRIEGNELYTPGFSRLSINYFFSEQTIEYILDALRFVSKYAIYFLPLYKFVLHLKTPIFVNTENNSTKIFSLKKIPMRYEKMNAQFQKKASQEDLKVYIKIAHRLLEKMKTRFISKEEMTRESTYPLEHEELRWFVIPSEASQWIYNKRRKLDSVSGTSRMEVSVDEEEEDERIKFPLIDKRYKSPINVNSKGSSISRNKSNTSRLSFKMH